jgi:TnpA family transposase
LERLVATVRQRAQTLTYERLAPLFSDPRQAWLDGLLEVDALLGKTPLAWLQHQPSSNSSPQILDALAKLQFLQDAGVPDWNLGALNPNRLKILARVAARSTNQALQRAPVERRYPTLVAFLKQALYNYTDEVVEMVDQHLWDTYSDARKEAEEAYLKAMRSTNEKLRTLLVLGQILNDPAVTDDAVRAEVFKHTPAEKMQRLLEETQRIIRPEQDAYVDYFGKRYGAIRRFAREFWRTLSFASYRQHDPLLKAVALLRQLDEVSKRPIPKDAPVTFIAEAWREYVQHGSTLYRRYYELAVLWELRTALRSGNVFVRNSRRHADPETYLIPRGEWPEHRAEVSRLTGTPTQGEVRLKQIEAELERLTGQLDALPEGGSVTLREEDGKLIHTPLVGEERSERVQQLEDEIVARLPQLDISDLLIEVDTWMHFSEHFEHAGGASSRSADLHRHLYAGLLTQACNFDVAQMARSSGLTYHQLAWVNTWYIREETLKAATNALVNYQYHHPLARLWDGGTLSSSDGQRFPVASDGRHARSLSRYFGPRKGLTAYTWTSDQMSQYGTKLIPATMRDATFVLDEILGNETELPIAEHTTDTAGYTELVFTLFDLLGLRFSPSIKDLGSQTLYHSGALDLGRYPRMKPHLPGRVDAHLFLAHWDDMLRFVGSLKLGWVTSSLMVAKLQAYPRQHLLTKVLQEYGRLPKTMHVLN